MPISSERNVGKVLVMAKGYPPTLGGVETYSSEIARNMAASGAEVYVITQFPGRVGWHKSPGISVFNVGEGPQWRVMWRMLGVLVKLKKQVPSINYAHATTWRVAVPLLVLGWPRRFSLTVHSRETLIPGGFLLSQVARYVFGRAVHIMAISRTALRLCGEKFSRIRQVGEFRYNGVSFSLGKQEAQFKISSLLEAGKPAQMLVACRLVERKNVGLAIKALGCLKQRGFKPLPVLSIAGVGPDLEVLKSLAVTQGIAKNVKFLGHVRHSDLKGLYARADMFLHPHSHTHDVRDVESFCLVIADAMAMAVPVISGNDGAPGEYITHGENGLLVSGTSPSELADAIALLVNDKEKTRKMAGNAYVYALRNFSWVKHVQVILEWSKHEIRSK